MPVKWLGSVIEDRFALTDESISAECIKLITGLLFEPLTSNDSFVEKIMHNANGPAAVLRGLLMQAGVEGIEEVHADIMKAIGAK